MLDIQKIRPLQDRILIKRSREKTSVGGILLPESAQEKPKEGEVVDVGPGKKNAKGVLEKPGVKKGDVVLFNSYSGVEITSKDEEYMILSEDDILGILS